MRVMLRPITASAAAAVLAGRAPDGMALAEDYPTEFSVEVAARVGGGDGLGPFFVHRREDDAVVGEIGGSFIEANTIMIGYAVVPSCWGRGYATDAVCELVSRAQRTGEVERVVANTPLDRPASARVLRKVGFTFVGDFDHEHDGVVMRVRRWELLLQR